MLIFDLKLKVLEKGKNAGIRPLFGRNRRLGGSYSGVSLYHLIEQSLLISSKYSQKWPHYLVGLKRTPLYEFLQKISIVGLVPVLTWSVVLGTLLRSFDMVEKSGELCKTRVSYIKLKSFVFANDQGFRFLLRT